MVKPWDLHEISFQAHIRDAHEGSSAPTVSSSSGASGGGTGGSVLRCSVCQTVTGSRAALQEHMKNHHGVLPWNKVRNPITVQWPAVKVTPFWRKCLLLNCYSIRRF